MKRGCFTYLMGCMVLMTISGFISSQGENLSDIEYIVSLSVALIVGYFTLHTLSEIFKKKFNPVFVDTVIGFFISVAVFCAFVLCLKRIG